MRARAENHLSPALFVILSAIGCYESHDLPPTPAVAVPGAACIDGGDCEGGLLCIVSERFPGGYCSRECGAGCPTGTRCDSGYLDGLCLAVCADARECRPGYSCFAGVCRPACTSDGECGLPRAVCRRGECIAADCIDDRECGAPDVCLRGRCTEPPRRDGGEALPIGAVCATGFECETGLCLPPHLGGTCARPCESRRECAFDEPCSPAPVDDDGDGRADFVRGACITGNPDGRFLGGQCNNDGQCESRACFGRQCVEVCEDARLDCLLGQACVGLFLEGAGGFMGCGYPGRGDPVVIEDIDLGVLSLSTSGLGTRVNFAIPDDTVSVTLVATRVGGSSVPIAYRSLFAPDETSLFDIVAIGEWMDQPIRWLPLSNEEAATISVPSSTPDRVAVLPGRYGTRLFLIGDGPGDTRTTEVQLSMRVKRARRLRTGTIDLDIYPVGVGFGAAEAPSEARLSGALSRLRGIWDAIGLSIGEIDYRDVPSDAATRLAVIDSIEGVDSEMSELFRLSAGGTPGALSFFLVRRISVEGREGGVALGIAGGIPGPPAVHGTMHSGVVVSYDASVVGAGSRGERNIAQVMAHEAGHYLGLYHNRERLRPCPDGTGPTVANPCAPFGGGDVIADTSRRDGDNLMWWSLGGDTGTRFNVTLSDGQAFVLLRSPVVGP